MGKGEIFLLLYVFCIKETVNKKLRGNMTNANGTKYYRWNDYSININDIRIIPSNIVRNPFPLYLDVAIFVDKESADLMNEDSIDTENYFNKIFRHVSQIFSLHNIAFSVKKIEYLGSKIVFGSENDGNEEVLNKIISAENYIYDAYVVFINIRTKGLVGYASVGTLCSKITYLFCDFGKKSQYNHKLVAEYFAHEMGHNLGFSHVKKSDGCRCGIDSHEYCLMNAIVEKWERDVPKSFEDCRMITLFSELDKYRCLLKPSLDKRLFTSCGDGVIDENEQCDSGHSYFCSHLENGDSCCNSSSCKFLKTEYQCSRGECCKYCKFQPNKVCRSSVGECDLEERCNTKYHECPVEQVEKNFKLCSNNGFCYNGICTDHNSLCKYVYNNDDVFFSQRCVTKTIDLIKNNCSGYSSDFKKNVCNNIIDPCQHFICAHPSHSQDNVNVFYSVRGGEVCLIPDISIKIGVFKYSANYMKCSKSHNNFCLAGKCETNTTKLKICRNIICTPIQNSRRSPIKELVYFPTNDISYNLLSFEDNEDIIKETFKHLFVQTKSNALKYFILISIDIFIIFGLLGIGVLSLFLRKLFRFHYPRI